MVDVTDLKSVGVSPCGFESHLPHQEVKMKIDELVDLFKMVGPLIVRVRPDNGLFDETYAEPGMVGRLIDAYFDSSDDCFVVKIDWNGFEPINNSLEARDWHLPSGELGTMKDAGMYPEDGIEKYWIESGTKPFDLVDSKQAAYYKRYLNYVEHGGDRLFLDWLFDFLP